ncbi:helix-turn-helix transcriptional regulator [Paraburkholderia silvatlantica]|uniref:DNA-binding transcriptional regulator YafY n=1 Tax=Paraburkholderia silvatlantica TaxID=321895 RepID=A0ABR6FZF1_9BURK|nr:WYL domain-containing protein [Paraburkholderia silvatlantica]MBB2932806.1 putative DNA-binding transcriptional regulator YafY [Paraburkholderia silvatlantica]PVY20776.1 putative DNA-binding transcriptional regulator YafY [Paraburkholderia silvatlantica]PXW25216.1 putative DNA-binding transcriptional regulator YafY [Paraburkholderia silvatlantica]
MATRPDTLNTTILAIELLRRIPRNRKVTAAELHDQLQHAGHGRDLRTIQRQLEMLCEHFDIECDDRSKPYGYCWKAQSGGLSLPVLSEQESLLLLLAEQHLNHLLPAGVMKSMDGFFEQARRNFGPTVAERPSQQWLKKIRVVSPTQPTLPPKIEDGVFDAVSNALYANLWLELEYRNAVGKSKSAEVMPLGLAQQGVRLYLVCRYKGYAEERILALHRIITACVTTRSFERPTDFNLEEYEADGKFGFGSGKRVRLSFCIERETALQLLESPLTPEQKVVTFDDRLEVSAVVVETVQLHRWLLGFGDKVWGVKLESLDDEPTEDGALAALRHILS